jgi:S-adenosylmethionine:tRNA-ribosyltransferase-isomerase (queuine synthetase)
MRPVVLNHLSTNFKLFRVKNINNQPNNIIGEPPPNDNDTIRITNQSSKHRLKHGHDFKDLLDALEKFVKLIFNAKTYGLFNS